MITTSELEEDPREQAETRKAVTRIGVFGGHNAAVDYDDDDD